METEVDSQSQPQSSLNSDSLVFKPTKHRAAPRISQDESDENMDHNERLLSTAADTQPDETKLVDEEPTEIDGEQDKDSASPFAKQLKEMLQNNDQEYKSRQKFLASYSQDTQVIAGDTQVLGDTQVIRRAPESLALADTQVIPVEIDRTAVKNGRTALADTQVIPKEDLQLNHETKDTNTNGTFFTLDSDIMEETQPDDVPDTEQTTKRLPDTQVIGNRRRDTPVLLGTLEDTETETQDDSLIIRPPESQPAGNSLADTQVIRPRDDSQRIPQPQTENNAKSQPQVLNTQEFSNLSLSESPEKDDTEIHTDNDEETVKEETVMSYDDSVSNHRLKRRLPQSPRKLKRSNTENIPALNHLSVSTPTVLKNDVLRQRSVPLVLASPEVTSGVTSSSPLKHKSIPEDEKSIHTDRVEGDTSNIDIEVFPSSPNKIARILFEEEHEPSELDESDDELQYKSSKAKKDKSPPDLDIVEISDNGRKINKDDLESFLVDVDDDDGDSDDPLDATYELGPLDGLIRPKPRTKNVLPSQSKSTTADDSQIDESTEPHIHRVEASDTLTELDIVNEEAVWALANLKMYPGLRVKEYQDGLSVQFLDDMTFVKPSDLNYLDIRIGDTVSVREDNHKYVVTGLSKLDSFKGISCMRGYNVVHLQRNRKKKKRNTEEITVMLSRCFMELSDWIKHQERCLLIVGHRDILKEEPGIPKAIKSRTLSRHASDINPEPLESQLFQGKLFFMTSIEGERKDVLKLTIEKNGGELWDRDINELFQFKQSEELVYLASESLSDFKFVALIANSHCRKAKYLQTLALGWPILLDRFIDDAVANAANLHSWHNYLLPSGVSTKLNTIKSCDVFKFRTNFNNGGLIKDQMGLNNRLLKDCNLAILQSKSINSEILDTCRFIFHAFGAKTLDYYTKTDEIAAAIKGSDSLMIFDDNHKISKLLANWNAKPGRKSKSKSVAVKVIDWEWVVQCVINETILEAETFTIHI
ncbi:DNA repair protein RAD9 [Candida viswanathii]|uniref:DNA repair protein RAD9 n=1 Tax=Candida viswanathii TaxID=5486 RepID=A0A367YHF3_9ASCO|nr:DNA repair protein RAD9 [Candida viswanathii]